MRDEYQREFYSQIMMHADPFMCEPGDWLEMFLFAHNAMNVVPVLSYNINNILFQSIIEASH